MTEWRVGDSVPIDEPEPPRRVLPRPSGKASRLVVLRRWIALLLLAYGAALLAPLLSIAVTVYHAISALKTSRRAACLALLLAPILPIGGRGFADALSDVRRGRAALFGEPEEDGALIDRATRIPYAAPCRHRVIDPAGHAVRDMATRFLARVCGPAPEAHQGWFPRSEEAFSLLASSRAQTIAWPDAEDLSGKSLGPVIARRLGLAEELDLAELVARCDVKRRFRGWRWAAVVDGRSELRVLAHRGSIFVGDDRLALLVSCQTGRVYACYKNPD